MTKVHTEVGKVRQGRALPEEVAAHLRTTLERLANDRYNRVGPPFIKHGRNVLYRWEDVYAWEAANTVQCNNTHGGAA